MDPVHDKNVKPGDTFLANFCTGVICSKQPANKSGKSLSAVLSWSLPSDAPLFLLSINDSINLPLRHKTVSDVATCPKEKG